MLEGYDGCGNLVFQEGAGVGFFDELHVGLDDEIVGDGAGLARSWNASRGSKDKGNRRFFEFALRKKRAKLRLG